MKNSAAVRLAACLLAAAVAGAPLPSWADSPPAPGGEIPAEKSAMVQKQAAQGGQSLSLEKAITLVKGQIPVPEGLDMFNSDYQEYGGSGRWLLRWHSGKTPEDNMTVTVNTATGEVENVNIYKGIKPGAQYRGLPAFSREQCLEIARKEAARMLPDKYSSTVLVPQEQWYQPSVLRDRDYPIINDFSFKRTTSGIRVSDQGINVGVNAETGEVVRLDCNWSPDAAFPPAGGRVSADEAKKIFIEKAGYELTYFMPSQADPDQPGEIRLVYRQKPPGRFILNAITGEMFGGRDIDFYFDEMGGGGGGAEPMYNRKMESKALSPAENRVVKETGDLISADRAQEIARSLVDVPRDYTTSSRNLERRYPIPESRVWTVQFSDPEKKNWIFVTVDAKTGELVSFNRDSGMNPEEYYKEPQVKFSQEEAQKTAWKLIAGLQPAR
ncbi:MAG: YcdB/YcdC domain-containing protein, partial [Desulfocucumaceae bacterium]